MNSPDLVAHGIAALAAFAISAVTGTAGVTGAFLLVPFQVSVLGIVTPSASATNHLYNVMAAPGGAWAYYRQGRMVLPLAAALVGGTVPGVLAGVLIRILYFPDPGRFKLFAGGVLLLLGLLVLFRGAPRRRARGRPQPAGSAIVRRSGWTRLEYEFDGRVRTVDPRRLALFALIVGVVGGCYGVGGGVFTSAYLVGVCRLPVHSTAGATLLATFFGSVTGVLGFQAAALLAGGIAAEASPIWTLGLALGAGGWLGGRLGARLQRHLPARFITAGLALLILALGALYAGRVL